MDVHRHALGEHVRATREAEGYRSRAAFGEAAGVSERSVAKVELGDPSVGKTVLRAVERLFGWPLDSASQYITDGVELPARAGPAADAEMSEARRRLVQMSNTELALRIAEVAEVQGGEAAGELLERILAIRAEARQRT